MSRPFQRRTPSFHTFAYRGSAIFPDKVTRYVIVVTRPTRYAGSYLIRVDGTIDRTPASYSLAFAQGAVASGSWRTTTLCAAELDAFESFLRHTRDTHAA